MSSIIQPNYGVRAYGVPTKASETKQTGTQGRSFLDLAARASRGTTDVLEIILASEKICQIIYAVMQHFLQQAYFCLQTCFCITKAAHQTIVPFAR